MAKRIYNQTALFGPLYAYLVVLSPPEHIKKQIGVIKQQLSVIADIGERNLRSIPHITLIDKLTDDTDFPCTVAEMLKHSESFEISISGWASFDHGHSTSLVLTIANAAPIITLTQNLKGSGRTPNISIAKRLSTESANLLVPFTKDRIVNLRWKCSEVIVLRKLMSAKHLGWNEKFIISLEK